MARRRRRNWTLATVLLLLAALLLGYVIGLPLLAACLAPEAIEAGNLPGQLTPLGEQIHFRLFEALIFAWLFMFGASIGSFLNVVIYRTPRGASLLGTSRCPRCCVAIRARDNIPVFGWLALRGRCRVCHLPISSRYPLVELTAAVLILVLATLEVLQAGANLPAEYESVVGRATISWLIRHPNWDLAATFGYHGALLCVLLSWALIHYDGFSVPRSYKLSVLVAAFALPILRPAVHPVPWSAEQPAWLSGHPWTDRIGTTLLGLTAGILVGCVLCWIDVLTRRRRECPDARPMNVITAFGLVGVVLGWQAILSVALLVVILQWILAMIRAGTVESHNRRFLLFVFLATVVHVYFWRSIEGLPSWPNASATGLTIALAASGIALFSALTGRRYDGRNARS